MNSRSHARKPGMKAPIDLMTSYAMLLPPKENPHRTSTTQVKNTRVARFYLSGHTFTLAFTSGVKPLDSGLLSAASDRVKSQVNPLASVGSPMNQ